MQQPGGSSIHGNGREQQQQQRQQHSAAAEGVFGFTPQLRTSSARLFAAMAQPPEITGAAIEEARVAGFSDRDKKGAALALARMKRKWCNEDISLDEATVALYCALRKIKQAGDTSRDVRIAPCLLRSWRFQDVRTTEEVIEYYVVPKCNAAEWAGNDIVPKCIIPPEEFDELPVSVNTNESYIMDDWALRHLLGPDVRKIRLSVGVRGSKEHVPTQPASASGSMEALPHSQAVEGPINDMEHEPHSSTDSVQQTRKESRGHAGGSKGTQALKATV